MKVRTLIMASILGLSFSAVSANAAVIIKTVKPRPLATKVVVVKPVAPLAVRPVVRIKRAVRAPRRVVRVSVR